MAAGCDLVRGTSLIKKRILNGKRELLQGERDLEAKVVHGRKSCDVTAQCIMGRGPEKDRREARIKWWDRGSHSQETHDLRSSGQGSVYKCPFSLLLPRVHTHCVMGSDKIRRAATWKHLGRDEPPRPARDRHYPGPC